MGRPLVLRPDGGVALTHEGLGDLREALERALNLPAKGAVLLYAPNDAPGAAALLALLGGRHAVAPLDPLADTAKAADLIAHWRPAAVLQFDEVARTPEPATPLGLDGLLEGVRVWRGPGDAPVHEALGLLLATSGTTGSPKFVRLSKDAVAHNASAIAEALAIGESDVGIAHLPLHYSYGLSVLTSHAARGAAVLPLESAIMAAPFWAAVKACGGTQFPGVPFHYETLARLGLSRLAPPSVTSFTQAGGHLDIKLRQRLHAEAAGRGARFYVMYGQTEAAPRMTTLDSGDFAARPDSVGRPLKDGRVVAEAEGELVYYGPNVMMGYAETPADLALGDVAGGRIATGDLGHVDAEGFVFITGRNARFAKVAGLRLALDEMERRVKSACDAALLPGANSVIVFVAPGGDAAALDEALSAMARDYRIPRASFRVREIEAIPVKSSGKVDYARLRDLG